MDCTSKLMQLLLNNYIIRNICSTTRSVSVHYLHLCIFRVLLYIYVLCGSCEKLHTHPWAHLLEIRWGRALRRGAHPHTVPGWRVGGDPSAKCSGHWLILSKEWIWGPGWGSGTTPGCSTVLEDLWKSSTEVQVKIWIKSDVCSQSRPGNKRIKCGFNPHCWGKSRIRHQTNVG